VEKKALAAVALALAHQRTSQNREYNTRQLYTRGLYNFRLSIIVTKKLFKTGSGAQNYSIVSKTTFKNVSGPQDSSLVRDMSSTGRFLGDL